MPSLMAPSQWPPRCCYCNGKVTFFIIYYSRRRKQLTRTTSIVRYVDCIFFHLKHVATSANSIIFFLFFLPNPPYFHYGSAHLSGRRGNALNTLILAHLLKHSWTIRIINLGQQFTQKALAWLAKGLIHNKNTFKLPPAAKCRCC